MMLGKNISFGSGKEWCKFVVVVVLVVVSGFLEKKLCIEYGRGCGVLV